MDFLWNFLTDIGLNSNEIQNIREVYLLLLLLPIVATIIGISRYILGLRTLNFYIPLFLTYIFFELSTVNESPNFLRGLGYGIVLFTVTFFISSLLYSILKRLRMHYIPKLSLVITGSAIATLIIIIFSLILDRKIFIAVSPFTLVVLVTATEGFMSVQAKKNFRYSLSIAFETLLTALLSYIFISIKDVQEYVIDNPAVIIIVIVINILVGRFLGLRLNEYWRFRKILFKQEKGDDISITDTKK